MHRLRERRLRTGKPRLLHPHPRPRPRLHPNSGPEQASKHLLPQPGAEASIEWCSHCSLYVRRPSAHCRQCNRCVLLMDHHCELLLVCAGPRLQPTQWHDCPAERRLSCAPRRALLRLRCIGKDNRAHFCAMLGWALAATGCNLLAALPALPQACAELPLIYAESTGAAGGPVLSSVARVAWARAPELRGCLPAAGLAFVCLYSSFALSGFVLQQLLFQVLVPARTGAADECWRQWAMRNLFPIPYWRQQRDQIVRIAQSK